MPKIINEPFPNPLNALVDIDEKRIWASGMDQTKVPSILKPLKIKNPFWIKYSDEFNKPIDKKSMKDTINVIKRDMERTFPKVPNWKKNSKNLQKVLTHYEFHHGKNTPDNQEYLQNFSFICGLCFIYCKYNVLNTYVAYCFLMKSKMYDWFFVLQMDGNSAFRRSLVMCIFYSFLQTLSAKFNKMEFTNDQENFPFTSFLFPKFMMFPLKDVLAHYAAEGDMEKFNELFEWIVINKKKPEKNLMLIASFLTYNITGFKIDESKLKDDKGKKLDYDIDSAPMTQLKKFFSEEGANSTKLDQPIVPYESVVKLTAKIENKHKTVNRYIKKIIDRYRRITGGWQKDTPPDGNPMYAMKHSMLMKISMPILSSMKRFAYEKMKKDKIRANRGGKKIKLKKNIFGEYNFKNINDGWTLLKKKTRKRKKKRKKRGRKKRSIKKYKY